MIFFPLYIDPGTGSMLFSLAIGIATAGVFALRSLVIKFKFIFKESDFIYEAPLSSAPIT